ncbi:MAG TPA: hypothetical protein VKV02_02305, partial [Acidobacteriaceae bacterium]|nr:hypothetical protein [Acidobacteriaceae bacterium]
MRNKWLHSLPYACLIALLSVCLLGFHAAKPVAAAAPSFTERAFPSDFNGSLPYDVDTARVGELLRPLRSLQKEGNTAEANARLLAAQREFDIMSWQAFLALNWPVTSDSDPSGTPITAKEGQPRWNYWRPSQNIFLPNGAPPPPWDAASAAEAQRTQKFNLVKTKAAWRQEASPQDNFEA